MKLLKLSLSNYCQYSKKNIDFDNGVTILRGKNGTGKSNFINAVFFALTGDSCIANKTRSGMLKWGEDRGYVELKFKAHGSEYKIRRQLHSSSVTLSGGSLAEDIKSSKEASSFVAKLIKADADVLKISSFMPQAGASELIFGTKSERQKAFSRLFRLLHLETIRSDLQKEFNKIPVYNDYSDIIASLSVDISAIEEGLRRLNLEKLSKYISDNRDKYQKMLECAGKRYSEKEYNELNTGYICEVTRKEKELSSLKEELASVPDPVIISSEESETYRRYKEFEKLCMDMLKAKERVDNPILIDPYVGAEDVLKAENAYNALVQNYREAEKKLKLVVAGKCSECGSVFEYTPEKIEDMKTELNDLHLKCGASQESLVKIREDADKCKETAAANQRNIDAFEELQMKVLKESEEFKDYDPTAFVDKQKEADKGHELMNRKSAINSTISATNADMAKIKADMAALHAEGFRPDYYSEEFKAEYEVKFAELQEANNNKSSFETALRLKKEQLESRKAETKLAALADKHRKYISGLRSVLHVDNYPRLAVAMRKEKLGNIINKYLDIFNQPFTVTIDDSLAFLCVFADNPEAVANDLSGGQKAMLLVSTRLAIAEMLASDVELLTFDEPGSAMDKDAKQDLLEAFETVRKYLSGQRIQMLVASHDDNIEGIADNVIHL